MIIFQTLKISNFKSIESAELSYTSGVWKVEGINNDTSFKSNGSGKTTILEAIQQCLFNKTTASPPIEDTTRKSVGKKVHKRTGYKLELTFTDGKDNYRIVNDREAMRIQIFVNEADMMVKSIPSALKQISTIIGMDFTTFVTLTFINHDTITDLLDNFSSSSLMKVILNFSQISDFEKSAKQEQKVINNSLSNTAARLQTLHDSLSLLDQYREIDMKPLHAKKAAITKAIFDIKDSLLPEVLTKEDKVKEVLAERTSAKSKFTKLQRKYKDSKCECCGQLLNLSEVDREKLLIELIGLEEHIVNLDLSVQGLELLASQHRETYNTTLDEVEQERQKINHTITIAQTKNQIYNDSKSQADDLRRQTIELEITQENLSFRSTVIQTALLVLKSGDIQKDLLSMFVAVLNIHLSHFIEFVSLDYINIKAIATKASVSFTLYDSRFNHNVSIHTLSGGEKTRLRLIVLLSMLQTIKEITSTASNIVIFDESLDTLDDSATSDLANLFDYLVHHDNKFIALVSHGEQLKEIEFTGIITAEKTNGVTKIKKETHVST